MRKSMAIMLVLGFLITSWMIVAKSAVSSAIIGGDCWVSKMPMHEARGRLGVAVVNGKIYAIGGDVGGLYGSVYGAMLSYTNINEEYDPATDTWAFKAPMPTPRGHFGIAVYQNKIYCIGGFNNDGDTEVNEVYDPATDTWETKAPMPVPRSSITANIVNGKIYVISAPYNSSSNYVYDPATDSWNTKTPPPHEITSYASAVVDNKIYFIATDYTASGLWLDPFIQTYNTENGKWSIGAYAPTYGINAVAGATTGVVAPKRIYFFDETGTQVYDPTNDRWSVGTSMPTLRSNVGVAVINDVFYAVGGEFLPLSNSLFGNITTSAVNEQYTPIGYGTPDPFYMPPTDITAPEIAIMSPENRTYYTTDIPLNVTVNEPSSWMRYKLDGKTVVEIDGNATLRGLSFGSHNISVYATDAAGNTGASETIFFNVAKPEPFSRTLVVAAVATVAAIVGVGLLVYFKKRQSSKSRASAF
jgi:N-acetylneuraminic acid mutarotase